MRPATLPRPPNDAYPTKTLATGYFDPEELAAAFQAGIPEEELLRRSWCLMVLLKFRTNWHPKIVT